MEEENSTTSHLSVVMTTEEVDVMQTTSGQSMTNDFKVYFQWAVIVIGVVGTATNALVLYALVASKQHQKHMLIVNQNALDLFSSCFLVITYSLKLCNFYLTGTHGYWLCMMMLSELLIYFGISGSIINLAIITIDRYLTVVHRIWVKNMAAILGGILGCGIRMARGNCIQYSYNFRYQRSGRWCMLRGCVLQQPCRSTGVRDQLHGVLLRLHNRPLHFLLRANSDHSSSSGTRDGRPQFGWIKYRSDPVKSASDQRDQDYDSNQLQTNVIKTMIQISFTPT